jgi:chemotaxis protein CheY-P-specific phosphatase CheC
MAESLISEICQDMGGISISRRPARQRPSVAMDKVSSYVNGEYSMEVELRAQPAMFRRLARHVIGGEPEREDVQDVATEFLNVICGRFISELCKETHVQPHLFPPQYTENGNSAYLDAGPSADTLFFETDQGEQAEFSWNGASVHKLLKRSEAE